MTGHQLVIRLMPAPTGGAQAEYMRRPGFARKASESRPVAIDLPTQMESLLDCVWQAEKTWRLMDRIDLAVAVEEQRRAQHLRRSLS
jgi:hypothetical protein